MYREESRQQQVEGFTLIEILIVLTIISILAAILFPVFARARENARRTSCLSNLKQIGLGVMMYTQDYDENYPRIIRGNWGDSDSYTRVTDNSLPGAHFSSHDGSNYGPWFTWMDMIHPYVKSWQLFSCPSAKDPQYPSYGYSYYLRRDSMISSQLKQASMTVISMDLNDLYTFTALRCTTAGVALIDENHRIHDKVTVHLKGANFLFFDGHAKWLPHNHPAPQSGTCGTSRDRWGLTASADNSNSVFWNPQGSITY